MKHHTTGEISEEAERIISLLFDKGYDDNEIAMILAMASKMSYGQHIFAVLRFLGLKDILSEENVKAAVLKARAEEEK